MAILDEHEINELAELLTLVRDEDGPTLSWPFLHRLKDLIGCDNLGFMGLDTGVQSDYFSQSLDEDEWWYDGPSPGPDADEDPFWLHYWDCPPCSHPGTSRYHTAVTKVSDYYSAREWRSTGMYVDHVATAGYEHEMMMWLPDGPGRTVRLICWRAPGRDFGERERFLLALLRPHIAEAYRAAVRRRNGPPPLTPRQVELLGLVRDGEHQSADQPAAGAVRGDRAHSPDQHLRPAGRHQPHRCGDPGAGARLLTTSRRRSPLWTAS